MLELIINIIAVFIKKIQEDAEDKPIILILHDENCSQDVHCREIRREFVEDSKLVNLSAHFHMINMMGEENHTNHWDPRVTNSWYTPRVFFLEPHVRYSSNSLKNQVT